MRVLKVNTKPSYEILIKENLLEEIPEDVKKNFDFGKIAIITDNKVKSIFGEKLLEGFKKIGIKSKIFSFPEGEQSKNIETVISLARKMIQNNFDRKDLIIALGGGVVGDIAGFLASIYLRGIPFIQVPTTLLAQVDSSVGGKTGIDLPEGKNLIGTFYQPLRVYIDPLVLKTLPKNELINGMAEVIKYGCILDKNLFYFVLEKAEKILKCSTPEIIEVIYTSCNLKANVVSMDEKETGYRRILNFGHTIGHAIESVLEYKIPHGFAVSVGMVVEAKISEKLKLCHKNLTEEIIKVLKKFELPYKLSHLSPKLEPSMILPALSKDKKVWKGTLTIILLKNIGQAIFYENPPYEVIKEALEEFC